MTWPDLFRFNLPLFAQEQLEFRPDREQLRFLRHWQPRSRPATKGVIRQASGAPLVADATGVGAAVLEMFRHPSIYLHPAVITGGDQVNYAAGRLHAPKAEIVTTLALLLEQDKFRLAHDLPLAAEFHREMTNYRVDPRPVGRFRFGASRAGAHDDLVMAVALAAWFTVRQHPHVLHDAHAPPPLTLF